MAGFFPTSENFPRFAVVGSDGKISCKMLINIHAAKCVGIEAEPVSVEVNIGKGIGIHLVGLADAAVKESLLRTMTALQSMGFHIPGRKIVINLAPADIHKKGSGYDLPIALGIIAASEQEKFPDLDRYLIMGELGLDASVRAVPGTLPFAELAVKTGLRGCILPLRSAGGADEFDGIEVYGVKDLEETLRILRGEEDVEDLLVRNRKGEAGPDADSPDSSPGVDFADIAGQEGARRGLEIAASGAHNVVMLGSPGCGKSSLAKALAGILPSMDRKEAMVVSKIYSVAGRGPESGLMRRRPFRSPHYSSSLAAMIGGGSGENIMPGEVSLAQGGVLFVDEYLQMPKAVSEALRAPLEDREVTISRLRAKVTYPASFMLVAASNPCPCGYYGEGDRCTCTPSMRQNYLGRLSGPVLDRIDIQLWLHSVEPSKIVRHVKSESSAEIAARVARTRDIQRRRFAGEPVSTNAEMDSRMIRQYCPLSPDCEDVLEKVMTRQNLSARAYSRIIKLARTIADMEEAPDIDVRHIAEAVGYRFLDRIL